MTGSVRFYPVWLLLAAVMAYMLLHADITVPLNRPFEQFPVAVRGWLMVSQEEFNEQVLQVLKPTDYLARTYAWSDGRPVRLYIGYHGGGKGGGDIHSPKHCLPGSGWYQASSRRITLDSGAGRINLVRAVYQKGDRKELFYYWFQVQEKTLSEEYSLKAASIVNSMIHRRRDASFIRISIPFESDEEAASRTGERFVADFYPVIKGFLPNPDHPGGR